MRRGRDSKGWATRSQNPKCTGCRGQCTIVPLNPPGGRESNFPGLGSGIGAPRGGGRECTFPDVAGRKHRPISCYSASFIHKRVRHTHPATRAPGIKLTQSIVLKNRLAERSQQPPARATHISDHTNIAYMASLEVVRGPDEMPKEPWKLHQRSGVLGVDYDDYGAEMAPEARVWKKYVDETDKTDKEQVEAWNRMLDIILLFAALFSAISTAFVIESSKDLKPDYAESAAQTLFRVSQALSDISRGLPVNESASASQELPEFTPSHSAVVVNALWFLSLSLSVAVSLIAILARDWCDSFMYRRVGSILMQGRLRQQRWDGIVRWRMREILNVLPLLMHIALLLFAIGLSVYLWDINVRVALPVVIITSLAGTFYVVTTSLPLFFQFCPYTTPLVRFLNPHWIKASTSPCITNFIGAVVASTTWISYGLKRLKRSVLSRGAPPATLTTGTGDLEATNGAQLSITPFSFHNTIDNVRDRIYQWAFSMRTYSADRIWLGQETTPMDEITSSMIGWMITNCEDPKSVDMAFQALAGAEIGLPRRPLWECEPVFPLTRRILNSTEILPFSGSMKQPEEDGFLDKASLYSRAFFFLVTFVKGEGLDISQEDNPIYVLEGISDSGPFPLYAHYFINDYSTLHRMLEYSWTRPSPRYEIAAYELNNIPTEISMDVWHSLNLKRQQCSRQWELLKLVTTKKVVGLPLNAMLSLLGGITKTYLYEPSQSPIPLLDLLQTLDTEHQDYGDISRALAIGLAVAAFASGSYPNQENNMDEISKNDRRKRARQALDELVIRKQMSTSEADCLIVFGLLSFLNQKSEHDWTFSLSDVHAIGKYLEHFFILPNPPSYHDMISIIPPSFSFGQHLAQVVSQCLVSSDQELDCSLASDSPALSRFDAATARGLCEEFSDYIIVPLTDRFIHTESPEIRRLCLRGVYFSLRQWGPGRTRTFTHLLKIGFLGRLLEATTSTNEDLVLSMMSLLWDATERSLYILSLSDEDGHPIFLSILRSLYNKFTVDLPEDSLPANVDEFGFTDLWASSLVTMCRDHPQAVYESGILIRMISFYEVEGRGSIKPRTTELSSQFDPSLTWIEILTELEKVRQAATDQRGEEIDKPDAVGETGPIVGDHREVEGRSPHLNQYWAM